MEIANPSNFQRIRRILEQFSCKVFHLGKVFHLAASSSLILCLPKIKHDCQHPSETNKCKITELLSLHQNTTYCSDICIKLTTIHIKVYIRIPDKNAHANFLKNPLVSFSFHYSANMEQVCDSHPNVQFPSVATTLSHCAHCHLN